MYFLFENSVISAIKNSIILMIVNNASKILVGEISAHIDDVFLYGDISYKIILSCWQQNLHIWA